MTLKLPDNMRELRTDRVGRPVPWFVPWIRTERGPVPEFRAYGEGKIEQAIGEELCWTCGRWLGREVAYPIGPMCVVNRVTAEPPSHKACAIYSVKACPFLSKPHMRRRPEGLEGAVVAGQMIARNPGAIAIFITTRPLHPYRVPQKLVNAGMGEGILFNIGEPKEILWFSDGRPATRAEVQASLDTGIPALYAMCERDTDPVAARQALAAEIERAMPLLPA